MRLESDNTNFDTSYPVPWASEFGIQVTETVTISAAELDAADYVNGFIPAGFALGKLTASGRHAKYDDANSNGTETLVGLLAYDQAIAAGQTIVVAMCTHRVVYNAKLPNTVDAAGIADLTTTTFK